MVNNDSFILRKSATLIALIVQIFAIYLFFRGHNLPGGGFIAGVASAIGIILLILANRTQIVARICPFDPLRLCAWGLALSVVSGLAGLVGSGQFLTHYHYKDTDFPVLGSLYLGTPLVFDLGVFMVVLGVIIKVTLAFMDALDKQAHFEEAPYAIPMAGEDKPLEATVDRKEPS